MPTGRINVNSGILSSNEKETPSFSKIGSILSAINELYLKIEREPKLTPMDNQSAPFLLFE